MLGPSKFVQVPNPYQKMKQHVKWDGEGVFAATMLLNRIDRASCHNSIHVLETPFTMKAEQKMNQCGELQNCYCTHHAIERFCLVGTAAAFITYNGLILQCINRWLFYQLCWGSSIQVWQKSSFTTFGRGTVPCPALLPSRFWSWDTFRSWAVLS